MIEKKWTLQEANRLDTFLQEQLPLIKEFSNNGSNKISNSKIRRLIFAGFVFVNNIQCKNPSFVVRKDSVVKVRIDLNKFFFEKQPDDIQFELTEKDVLFEDDVIIVVNKPAFFPTEETIVKGRKNMHQAVVDYLWKKNSSLRNPPYVGIMHRLDKETSGVLLFTKSRTVNAFVHDMFENHTAKKTYRAVCSFSSNAYAKKIEVKDSFCVDNFIARISAKSSACKMGIVPQSRGGLHSHTDFLVIKRTKDFFYVEARPLTGRTHQIRTHLSFCNLPIVGDSLYGGKKGFDFNNKRIMLHALSLEFPHPVTKDKIIVKAPLPQGFN